MRNQLRAYCLSSSPNCELNLEKFENLRENGFVQCYITMVRIALEFRDGYLATTDQYRATTYWFAMGKENNWRSWFRTAITTKRQQSRLWVLDNSKKNTTQSQKRTHTHTPKNSFTSLRIFIYFIPFFIHPCCVFFFRSGLLSVVCSLAVALMISVIVVYIRIVLIVLQLSLTYAIHVSLSICQFISICISCCCCCCCWCAFLYYLFCILITFHCVCIRNEWASI